MCIIRFHFVSSQRWFRSFVIRKDFCASQDFEIIHYCEQNNQVEEKTHKKCIVKEFLVSFVMLLWYWHCDEAPVISLKKIFSRDQCCNYLHLFKFEARRALAFYGFENDLKIVFIAHQGFDCTIHHWIDEIMSHVKLHNRSKVAQNKSVHCQTVNYPQISRRKWATLNHPNRT